jgi:hypothetical protein
VADVGTGVGASRNATEDCVAAPAAAASHAVRDLGIRLRRGKVLAIPILTPLIYVATHVMNTKFIRFFRTCRMSFVAGIVPIPGYLVNIITVTVFVTLTYNFNLKCYLIE